MWTKSYIQLQVESIQERAKFSQDIANLLEKYTISDAVFGIINGNTCELSTGYFVESGRYTDLEEAVRNMDQKSQALRICENEYIVGDLYRTLSEIDESAKSIFSIEFLEDVR